MVFLLRAAARVVAAVWMVVLALFGLAVGLFCLDGLVGLGGARPDRLLHLPSLRRHVAHVLAGLAAPGSTAGLALLLGLGAMGLGILLLVGLLARSRRRLAVLDRDADTGILAARPRVLRDMARALAEQADGISGVRRPRLALRRGGAGGRLTVTAAHPVSADGDVVQAAVRERLAPLSEPFGLRPRVHVHRGERGERVQ